MSEIRLKAEHLPARCEICHQDDRFDPVANYCSRCSQLQPAGTTITVSPSKKLTLTNIEVGIAIGMSVGLLIGLSYATITLNLKIFGPTLILGYFGLMLGGVYGFIYGMIAGKSLHATDGADGKLAPKVVSSAILNTRYKSGLRKFEGLIFGTLKSAAIIICLGIILTGFEIGTLLRHGQLLLTWIILATLIGAPIEFVCKNRSDRRG